MAIPEPGADPLTVTVTDLDGAPALRLRGDIDVLTAADFRAYLDSVIVSWTGDLVIDMTELMFVDSSGIAQLVRAARHLDDGRTLILHEPTGSVRKVIETTSLASAPAVVVRATDKRECPTGRNWLKRTP